MGFLKQSQSWFIGMTCRVVTDLIPLTTHWFELDQAEYSKKTRKRISPFHVVIRNPIFRYSFNDA